MNPAKMELEAESPVSEPLPNNIIFSSTTEFKALSSTSSHIFLASADLRGPFFEAKSRAPLNFIAVIDRSGSMSGEKIKLVHSKLSQ